MFYGSSWSDGSVAGLVLQPGKQLMSTAVSKKVGQPRIIRQKVDMRQKMLEITGSLNSKRTVL
jgi:hypothetical protein